MQELNLNIIEELVKYVNIQLVKGKSIATIERENGLGKDTLRKRLNRNFYYYNKTEKQFIYNEEKAKNKNNITHYNSMCYKKDKTAYNTIKQKDIIGGAEDMEKEKIAEFKALSTEEKVKRVNALTQGVKTLTQIQDKLGFTNVGNYIPKSEAYWDGKEKIYKLVTKSDTIFSSDEVAVLKEIIGNYKKQKSIKTEEFEGEVVTRSFRSYKNVMEQFADFCSKNNLNQKDAVATALTNFIRENS